MNVLRAKRSIVSLKTRNFITFVGDYSYKKNEWEKQVYYRSSQSKSFGFHTTEAGASAERGFLLILVFGCGNYIYGQNYHQYININFNMKKTAILILLIVICACTTKTNNTNYKTATQ